MKFNHHNYDERNIVFKLMVLLVRLYVITEDDADIALSHWYY